MKLFAALREQAGVRERELELADGARIEDVWPALDLGDEPRGLVYAVNRATGELRWQFAAGDWATADPVIAGGIVYFAIGNHADGTAQLPFYALAVATGEQLWSFITDGLVVEAATLADGVIYLSTGSGIIYALE